jgi:hypothetical protein
LGCRREYEPDAPNVTGGSDGVVTHDRGIGHVLVMRFVPHMKPMSDEATPR